MDHEQQLRAYLERPESQKDPTVVAIIHIVLSLLDGSREQRYNRKWDDPAFRPGSSGFDTILRSELGLPADTPPSLTVYEELTGEGEDSGV